GDRDGFRHVHFAHDRFRGREGRTVVLVLAAATARTAAPVAIDAAARVAARLDAAALRRIVLPAARLRARRTALLVAGGSARRGRRGHGLLDGRACGRAFGARRLV